MTPKAKFLVGGVFVLGSSGILAWNSIARSSLYYLTPPQLAARIASDSTFRETGIKLGARVVPGSIVRAAGGKEVAFRVTDSAKVVVYAVHYRGIIPDTFSDSADVVVDGRLDPENTFQATTLLAKCGSRFESAVPGAYQKGPQPRKS